MNLRQSSRPAHSPDYLITIDGKQISPQLGARLKRLTLNDRRGLESDQLDLTLADHDGRLALPTRGAELRVKIGWRHAGLVDRGWFVVDEIEHSGAPDELIIRARASDMRNNMPIKRSQSYHGTVIADIVQQIAQRNGLSPQISQTLAGVPIEHIDQTDESDLNFLTRLAERFDADATVKAGRLLFIPKGQAQTASGIAIPPITLTRQSGDRHRYLLSDRDSFTGVVAYWQDLDAAQRKSVIIGGGDRLKSLRGSFASEDEAQHEASAEWGRIQRAGSSMTLELAEGNPELYPETPIRTRGYKAEIDAIEWVATEVMHQISDTAYTSSITLEMLSAQNNE
jgi:uncharacterized protein